MVLRIFKMIAISRFLAALEYTEFVFSRGFTQTSLGEHILRSPGPVVG